MPGSNTLHEGSAMAISSAVYRFTLTTDTMTSIPGSATLVRLAFVATRCNRAEQLWVLGSFVWKTAGCLLFRFWRQA